MTKPRIKVHQFPNSPGITVIEVKTMNQQTMLRTLKQTAPSNADEWMEEEINNMAKDESTKLQFENIPTVGCGTIENPRKIIFIEFLGEPKLGEDGEPKLCDDGKAHAWAEVKLLKPTQGWDRKLKQNVQLAAGTKCSVDLARHKGAWTGIKQYQPLTGKKFAMATVGRVKTANGLAFDYRYKENPEGI